MTAPRENPASARPKSTTRVVIEPPTPTPPAGRLARFLAVAFVMIIVTFVVAGFTVYNTLAADLPDFADPSQYRPALTTRFYARDARLVGEFAEERRVLIPYEEIPLRIKQAFVAAEDASFFDHKGINPIAIARAALTNLKEQRKAQGGSTITQQVAKTLVGREKTYRRKLREMIVAFRLEANLGKKDILWIYLNQIYLGHGAYGVEAAAQNYFRKHVNELSLAQMAVLAGLPQAPSAYDPYRRPQAARERQEYVLRRMFEEGYITAEERDEALNEQVVVNSIRDYFRDEAPYFTEHVRRYIYDNYGADALYRGGLRVELTMDLDAQLAAEKALMNGVRRVDKRQGFRGPVTHLTPDKFDDFNKKADDFYAAEARQLGRNPDDWNFDRIYAALVTRLERNGKDKAAFVSIGKRNAIIPIDNMSWAKKPAFGGEFTRISDPGEALKTGDVVLVRLDRPESEDGTPVARSDWKPKLKNALPVMRLEQIPAVQGALVSIEPKLGYVKAMIGGYDFEASEFNRAFQACRQPGSAFKPIVYAAAIEKLGYHPSTIIVDSPIVYDDPTNQHRWKPANYENDHKGDVPLRQAIINSLNLPAIKVLQAVGVDTAADYAAHLGIRTKLNRDLSIALGSSCVTPYDLTRVYAVFSQLGLRDEHHFVRAIYDRDGHLLEDNRSPFDTWLAFDERLDAAIRESWKLDEQLMDPADAFVLTHLLSEVCMYGTAAAAAALGQPVAGKTGTTNDAFDAWFMGYTPNIVTGVWVGFDTYETPLGRWETGGKAALPIWMEYTKAALRGKKEPPFPRPEGVVGMRVDPDTGLIARDDSARGVVEYFKKGNVPTEEMPERGTVAPDDIYRYDMN